MTLKRKYLIAWTGLILLMIIFTSCNLKGHKQKDESLRDSLTSANPVLRYGLPVDSFIVKSGIIKPNQHLSSILSNCGVKMGTIDQIAKKCIDVFDVRKIRSGQKLYCFHKQDLIETPIFCL